MKTMHLGWTLHRNNSAKVYLTTTSLLFRMYVEVKGYHWPIYHMYKYTFVVCLPCSAVVVAPVSAITTCCRKHPEVCHNRRSIVSD